MNQHHVGGRRADHGPKHAPGVISDKGWPEMGDKGRLPQPIRSSAGEISRPKGLDRDVPVTEVLTLVFVAARLPEGRALGYPRALMLLQRMTDPALRVCPGAMGRIVARHLQRQLWRMPRSSMLFGRAAALGRTTARDTDHDAGQARAVPHVTGPVMRSHLPGAADCLSSAAITLTPTMTARRRITI